MSKLIKKYKENYRNFLGIFKGLFEHAGGVNSQKPSRICRNGGYEKRNWKGKAKRWA
jgi:hypothetical protein